MKSLMYAVIATGGKQEKVETGQVLNVELLQADEGSEVSFNPILLVDDGAVMSTADELSGSSVTARIVGETKGEKIRGFTYKNKTNSHRRWGHRQRYTTIEITNIARG
jgi:large subunit ribosomal protein L21